MNECIGLSERLCCWRPATVLEVWLTILRREISSPMLFAHSKFIAYAQQNL
jgi:hypothetical protein